MEPSVITISIDKEIKFKKIDLELLRNSKNGRVKSKVYCACTISNVQYCLTIYPNGTQENNRGRVFIFFRLIKENDINVDSQIMLYCKSMNFEHTFEMGKGPYISSTSKFFDSKFFIDGEMIVNVKGTFKIVLPNKKVYPISAEWKIKESDLEALNAENKNYLNSKNFPISSNSEINYYLIFWPCDNQQNENKAAIFFYLNLGTIPKIEADITFRIDSANSKTIFKYVYEKSEGRGGYICSTDDLFNPENRYFVDGEMTINVTGTLSIENGTVEPTILKCEKGIASKAYQKHRGKEFTIVAGDKNIKVHKKVLIEASPVFEAMFSSGMIEVTEKKMTIPDFPAEIVEAALKLLYSDSIPSNFTFEQILSLLQFADKYDIKLIMDLIQEYLVPKISPSNVCYLINFTMTTTVSATKLHSKCVEYLIKCSKESKAVHNLDTLDKDFAYQILMKTFTQSL